MSDAPQQPGADRRGDRRAGSSLGSAYFLGVVAVALVVMLWLRGLGRLMIPALFVGAVVYAVYRFVKLVRAPVD